MGLHIGKLQFSPSLTIKHASKLEYCHKYDSFCNSLCIRTRTNQNFETSITAGFEDIQIFRRKYFFTKSHILDKNVSKTKVYITIIFSGVLNNFLFTKFNVYMNVSATFECLVYDFHR